eukprot:3461900-Amphidinium_carterae.1
MAILRMMAFLDSGELAVERVPPKRLLPMQSSKWSIRSPSVNDYANLRAQLSAAYSLTENTSLTIPHSANEL